MEETRKIKVAINGAGRIGRAFLKKAWKHPELEIVAINDLGDIENIAYLLKYDTVYGRSGLDVSADVERKIITIDGKEIAFLSERDPAQLPWAAMEVDVALESTGAFTEYAKAKFHLDAGAKRVVISAPAKGDPVEGIESSTILMGVNQEKLQTCQISSNGSCTTNAGGGVMQVLSDELGVEKALLTTVHAYTSTQAIVDGPAKKDFRKGRAAAQNIIPTTTGAAIATTEAIPELKGKFNGIAMRVPVPAGSIADITFLASRDTTVEEVNSILKNAADTGRWNTVFSYTEEPFVSSDIIGTEFAGIVDLSMTMVVGGNLVKVLSWYDNESGYTRTLVDHVVATGTYAAGV